MAPPNLPALPPTLKGIQHYLKIAIDYENRDPPIAYWSRLHAFQQGLTLKKAKEDMAFLMALMDWLEKTKTELKGHETISDEIVAQAHIENVAIKLFLWADNEDRAGRYNKNVVKAFYSAGMLLDVCMVFGEMNEDVAQQKKYAKWRAAHLHNCLNTGEQPSEPAPKPDEGVLNDSENQEFGLPSSADHPRLQDSASALPTAATHYPPPAGPSFVAAPSAVPTYVQESNASHSITPEGMAQAQKFCKYASSALTYEDIPTAIDNLQKALRLLQTGQ